MELIQDIAVNNPCYKAGKKITITGIMLEGVGCPQPSAKVLSHNWNRESCEGRCAHAFIDANDGSVIQTLPWNHRGWHCGRHPATKNSANYTHIGVKMCEPAQIRYDKKHRMSLCGDKEVAIAAVHKTYKSAVELLAMLCAMFNLDPMTDIITPKEGYQKRICAFRNDVEGLWERLDLDYTMDGLRNDVKAMMGSEVKDESEEAPSELVNDVEFSDQPVALDEAPSEPVNDLELENQSSAPDVDLPESKVLTRIQIDIDNLRIRSTPEISNNVTGKYTGKGVFEILEIQNGNGSKSGWGKLADGSGWVCLDFVTVL